MGLFSTTPRPAVHTLRVLAHLLRYPDAELRAHVAELRAALRDEAALYAPHDSAWNTLRVAKSLVWGLLLGTPVLMIVKAVCDRVDDFRPLGALLER